MKAQYTQSKTANAVKFNVTPATAFKGIGVQVMLAVCWLMVIGAIAKFVSWGNTPMGSHEPTNRAGTITFLVLFGAAMLIMRYRFKRRESKLRAPSSFEAGATGVSINGQSIARETIHRFIIKNWMTDAEQSYVTAYAVAYTPNLAGTLQAGAMVLQQGAGQVGKAVGESYRKNFAKSCWQLDVEAGGRATMLACGLDEVTANGLMQDVHRAVAD